MSGLSSLSNFGFGLLAIVDDVLTYAASLIETITGLTLF